MNIMVFDVPAERGGALSILNDFYDEVKSHSCKGTRWLFVVGRVNLQATQNIDVLRFPWVKSSWGHRLYFDQVVAPNLVRKHSADRILSLQNVVIPGARIPQVLYVHQPLPFTEYRFGLYQSPIYWTYQNIIGKLIRNSIRKADKVIVQTEWMRSAIVEDKLTSLPKIHVVPPKISLPTNLQVVDSKGIYPTFFFPSSPELYKNHQVIIDAATILDQNGFRDYKVIFTITGNENKIAKRSFRQVSRENLPIEFIGAVSRQEVFDILLRSILIFPSYIETFGLPLLEARELGRQILASNCQFSREILEGYSHVQFFDPFDAKSLARLILQTSKGNWRDEMPKRTSHMKNREKGILDILLECNSVTV